MKRILILITLLWLPMSCTQKGSKPITEFTKKDLTSGILVDVRTPEEFSEGHLEGAVNVDVLRGDFVRAFDTVPKNKPLYLYCKMGGRSARAARMLDSLGFSVTDLSGGYDAWLKKQP